jgi:transcriptional regulator with XRE-family HTH domain
MSSVKSQLLDSFKTSKEYRHAFVEEKVRTQLAVQIKTIREQQKISRPTFAALMQKANSWVFRLEDPNQPPPTISTLLQVAEAFDVDLDISFKRFSDLLHRIERMTPESFEVPSFEEELKDRSFERSPNDAEMHEALTELRAGAGAGGYAPPRAATGAVKVLFMPGPAICKGSRTRARRSYRNKRRSIDRVITTQRTERIA